MYWNCIWYRQIYFLQPSVPVEWVYLRRAKAEFIIKLPQYREHPHTKNDSLDYGNHIHKRAFLIAVVLK